MWYNDVGQVSYSGSIDTMNKGLCKTGQRYCNANGTWGSCTGEVLPQIEVCDGLDNDCDGLTDDGVTIREDTNCNGVDEDCDGIKDDDYIVAITTITCGAGACVKNGQLICQNGTIVSICQPGPPTSEGPMGSSSCNDLIDNDCDGTIDNEDSGCDELSCYITNPYRDQTCDGIDDNCNGQIDEDYIPTNSSCGKGVCAATGKTICQSGLIVNTCTTKTPTENPEITCNDNIDNDCDGTKDSNDVNCYSDNYAIDFSRTSNQAGIVTSRISVGGKPVTIETWVKKKTEENLNGNIFRINDISIYAKNNIIKITASPTSTEPYSISCGESLLTNVWTHIVAMLTNENHISGPNNCSMVGSEKPHTACYVNGELKNCGSTNGSYPNPVDGPIYIGAQYTLSVYDGLDSTTKFFGAIDDVRLWTIPRTQSEIQQCMNLTLGLSVECNIDRTKLIGYWPLNEGFGSTAYDVSGNNKNGSISWTDGWIPGYPLVLP